LLIRFCWLLRHVCFWSGFVCCSGISRRPITLGMAVCNPTPVHHPMGDRFLSKSRQPFLIIELERYIILIGSQFIASCLLVIVI
jgi:hypothetical protein